MNSIDIERFGPATAGRNRTAIVFVHGFSGDRKATWGRIPDLLQQDPRLEGWDMYGFGYQSRKSIDFLGIWSADPALEQIAVKLRTTLELGQKNNDALAFVAHSMGGLVVQRALVISPELRRRTTHLFMFGTPSAGLEKATLFSWLKQHVNNMSASGEFIIRLRSDWSALTLDTAPPFKLFVIAGETDQFVPPKSSLEPFPDAFRYVIPGNHLSMLNARVREDPCVKLLRSGITEGAWLAGARDSARVAVESGKFRDAIDRLWPVRDQLDDGGAVQLAIALDRVNRREEAIELLRNRKPEGTDVLGVLAGRLKRRWLVTRAAGDFKSALDLYRRGYDEAIARIPPDNDQAHYHGINLAYLALAGTNRSEQMAREMANKVLEHAKMARNQKEQHWQLASEGDALIILGQIKEGFEKHKEAAAIVSEPWAALSMEEQALRIADLCNLDNAQAGKLAAIYEG
jgi:pimeloyl-ACP methyl ester carboxylesterase